MDTPLREGLQISLDSGLLTEIFQCFTLVQPDSVDVFEGHLERSESIDGVRITRLRLAAIQRLPTRIAITVDIG